MKKIVFIIITVVAVFSLQAETFAMKANRSAVLKDEGCPQTNFILKNKTDPVEIHRKTVMTSFERKETSPVYCPEANLTIVDSKQVKVKYELWIIKVLKNLFR